MTTAFSPDMVSSHSVSDFQHDRPAKAKIVEDVLLFLVPAHERLRRKAVLLSKGPAVSVEDAVSLFRLWESHEKEESAMLSLSFLRLPPPSVRETATALLRTGAGLVGSAPSASAANGLPHMLIAHMKAEEDWLRMERSRLMEA